MRSLAKRLAIGAVLGVALAASAPANAGVSLSVGIGGPVYFGYNYERPCSWYRFHGYPAPYRCLAYYRGVWGPRVYVDGDFIFRDRDDWDHWRDRDDYRHWRGHDWGHRDRDHYDHDHRDGHRDNGWHGRDHDRGDWHHDRF